MSQFFPPKEPSTEELLACVNKSLPYSDEAEMGVLSCLLQAPDDRIPELKSIVPAIAFYHVANRIVYELLIEMWDATIPIDIAVITHALREKRQLDKVGGGAAISELYTFTPVTAHYPFYLKVLMDKFHLRNLIRASAKNILAAQQHGRQHIDEDIDDTLNEAERLVRSVRDGTSAGEFRPTSEWMDDLADSIDRQVTKCRNLELTGETVIAGISTGLDLIDQRTNGYRQGHVWLVQARYSDGKTSWARQQGLQLVMAPRPVPVVYYLTEGAPMDFWKCCLAHLTRIDINRIFTGDLIAEEITLLSMTMSDLKTRPFFLRHKPGISKREILTDMRLMHRKHAVVDVESDDPQMMFIVDYLQRVKGRDRGQEQHEHLLSVSGEITDLTGNLKSTTIMLAQLADDMKTAGSKAVPCDADKVVTISCPPKIDEHGKPMQKTGRFGDIVITERDESKRVITFGKNRDGKRGGQPVTLAFSGETQRFS